MTVMHDIRALLSDDDWAILERYVPDCRDPNLVISHEEGGPYIYRWHLIPRNDVGNVYFHIQVRDDRDRALHDHNYDNMSVILAGGYVEYLLKRQPYGCVEKYNRRPGQTVYRRAEWSHRLELAPDVRYSMSLFTTGPRIKPWGFWVRPDNGAPAVWVDALEYLETPTPGYEAWKPKEPAL